MEGGHDLGVVPGVGPVEVLAKDNIAEPMEAVLYPPTTLALGCDVAGGGLYHQQATDEVDHLAVVTPLIGAGTVVGGEACAASGKTTHSGARSADDSGGAAAMRGASGGVGRNRAPQEGSQLLFKSGLVVRDGEEAVTALADDPAGGGVLGVDADQQVS